MRWRDQSGARSCSSCAGCTPWCKSAASSAPLVGTCPTSSTNRICQPARNSSRSVSHSSPLESCFVSRMKSCNEILTIRGIKLHANSPHVAWYKAYLRSNVQSHLLEMDAKKAASPTWETVRYMVAAIQYGGRITDDLDQLLMDTYAARFFHQARRSRDFSRHVSPALNPQFRSMIQTAISLPLIVASF